MESSYKRVNKRDFVQYTSKWLKEVPIIVTNRGVDEYVIEVASNVATKQEVATKPKDNVATKDSMEVKEYGCGCRRESGKVLCGKHGRL